MKNTPIKLRWKWTDGFTHEGREEVKASDEQQDFNGELPDEENVRDSDSKAVQKEEYDDNVSHKFPIKLLGDFRVAEQLHLLAWLALPSPNTIPIEAERRGKWNTRM